MHKNRMWFTLLLFLVLLLSPCTCQAQENTGPYQNFIRDEAGLLTEEEKQELYSLMEADPIDGNLGIYTFPDSGNRRKERDTIEYAFAEYHKSYGTANGTVLVIDMKTRYIEIISSGENARIITDYDAATITDNIYAYASAAEYFGAMQEGITQIQRLMYGRKIPRTMKLVCNLFIAMLLSLIANFYLLKQTSRLPKPSRKSLLNAAKVTYAVKDEQFEYDSTSYYTVEPGSIEAVRESRGIGLKLLQLLILILRCIASVLMHSSGGGSHRSSGGSSHRSSGSSSHRSSGSSHRSSSSGGRRSSGGHRF